MKKRGRAKRWWIVGGVVLVMVLASLYVYGRQVYSESRSVLAFVDALEGEDASRLAALLKPDRGSVAIDEASARKLLDYLGENNLIDKAIADVQRGTESYMADSRLFAVVKSGRHYGLFARYLIAVSTSEVEVSTNFKEAVIKLDGQQAATADSDEYRSVLGPLIPGRYELEAIYDGEYAHMEAKRQISVEGGGTVAADLSFNGGRVRVDANYENAAIYIDGKNTGAVTGGSDELGPVALDGSSRVHAELAFPWGVAKSKPIPIESESIHIQIDPNTDELKDAVMAAVTACIETWTDAYNKLDPTVVVHLSKERQTELAASIDDYKAQGMRNETVEKKLVFDTDSIYVQQDEDDSYWTAVSLRRQYVSRYYAAGETPPSFEAYTDTMTYRLILKDGDWVVTDWYEEYNFDPAHTKEWTFPA